MQFPNDNNPKLLKTLLTELGTTVQILKGKPAQVGEPDTDDAEILKKRCLVLCDAIYELAPDAHLKAIVNSVFDTWSVEETIDDLERWNKGEGAKKRN